LCRSDGLTQKEPPRFPAFFKRVIAAGGGRTGTKRSRTSQVPARNFCRIFSPVQRARDPLEKHLYPCNPLHQIFRHALFSVKLRRKLCRDVKQGRGWGRTGTKLARSEADPRPGSTPVRYPPRPKPHCLIHPVAVTLLNMTPTIPAGDRLFIPARFRVFPNHDLSYTGIEGKVVQPGSQRALMYQNSYRVFFNDENSFLR